MIFHVFPCQLQEAEPIYVNLIEEVKQFEVLAMHNRRQDVLEYNENIMQGTNTNQILYFSEKPSFPKTSIWEPSNLSKDMSLELRTARK